MHIQKCSFYNSVYALYKFIFYEVENEKNVNNFILSRALRREKSLIMSKVYHLKNSLVKIEEF